MRGRTVRLRLCVLSVLAGEDAMSLRTGLMAVGAVYCLAALIRILEGM